MDCVSLSLSLFFIVKRQSWLYKSQYLALAAPYPALVPQNRTQREKQMFDYNIGK